MRIPTISAEEAVAYIKDGTTVAIGGSGAGHAIPDKLLEALGHRFRATGAPRGLTLVHPFGVGNQKDRGLEHIAHPEMYRRVIGGHWSMSPSMAKLATENAFEAYCLPAGIMIQLFHSAACSSPAFLSRTGLHSFVDPRLEGGKLNQKATEDLVELITRDGEEYLLYRTHPIDVALLHASEADPDGNLGMNNEAGFWHNLALAQAAKATGGITIVVVRHRVGERGVHPRNVRVPACFVDYIVEDPDQGMTYQTNHDPSFSGDEVKPDSEFSAFPLSVRKVIARRAALELAPGAILNVGFGMADGVVKVAREQGIADTFTTTIEHGQFGGIPAEGLDFGAMYNPAAIVETGPMLSFYQGRGVDLAFLGFLEIDRTGNVNVSKLGDTVIGTGGFIDIVGGARKVVFCGTLAVRAKMELTGSGLRYTTHGKPKVVEKVLQVTFSGDHARRQHQEVVYVTESAVFRLTDAGLRLEEIAPGVGLESDLIPQLGFRPAMADPVRTMPRELFRNELLPGNLFRNYP